jgi:hypothetical protein
MLGTREAATEEVTAPQWKAENSGVVAENSAGVEEEDHLLHRHARPREEVQTKIPGFRTVALPQGLENQAGHPPQEGPSGMSEVALQGFLESAPYALRTDRLRNNQSSRASLVDRRVGPLRLE